MLFIIELQREDTREKILKNFLIYLVIMRGRNPNETKTYAKLIEIALNDSGGAGTSFRSSILLPAV